MRNWKTSRRVVVVLSTSLFFLIVLVGIMAGKSRFTGPLFASAVNCMQAAGSSKCDDERAFAMKKDYLVLSLIVVVALGCSVVVGRYGLRSMGESNEQSLEHVARMEFKNVRKVPHDICVEPWGPAYTLLPEEELEVVAFGRDASPRFAQVTENEGSTQIWIEGADDFAVNKDGKQI